MSAELRQTEVKTLNISFSFEANAGIRHFPPWKILVDILKMVCVAVYMSKTYTSENGHLSL